MIGCSRAAVLIVAVLFFCGQDVLFAQAPNISYTTPQSYIVNKPVTPLSPANTGGAVPAGVYGQVSTFAGSIQNGAIDGNGKKASFAEPLGLCIDKQDNVYIADIGNNKIRKVDPSGAVSTIAGTGFPSLKNGAGISAEFYEPNNLACDGSGNLFVSDAGNNVIGKISTSNVVSTFAGNGNEVDADGQALGASFNVPAGLNVDAAGNVFVADAGSSQIRKISIDGAVTTLIAHTDGFAPFGMCIDKSGNLYVTSFSSVRKITPDGVLTIVAGSSAPGYEDGNGSSARFNNAHGVAIDAAGYLYVADGVNNVIRKISPAGDVSTIAGSGRQGYTNGPGLSAKFYFPSDLVINSRNELIIADSQNNMLRKVSLTGYSIDKILPAGLNFDTSTGAISGTPAAASPATNYTITAYNSAGSSSTVISIAVNGTSPPVVLPPNITYQTPQTYHVNSIIAPLPPQNTGGPVPAVIYGEVLTIAGTGSQGNGNGSAGAASFGNPVGLVFDAPGNLYVSEYINNDVRKITPAGAVSTFAGTGASGSANGPGNHASFSAPYQLAKDASGNIYVADDDNMMIRKITPDGVVSLYAGTGAQGSNDGAIASSTFDNPLGLAMDGAGNLFIADKGDDRIRKIGTDGQVSTLGIFDGGAPPPNTTIGVGFLATDAAGNLYFGDTNQIKELTTAGLVNVIAGNLLAGSVNGYGASARFNRVVGVAVDGPGNIYVGDAGNNLVRKIDPTGKVTTLAGSGGNGAADGLGLSASFHSPYGVTIDNTGDFLYVADSNNQLIRKIGITGYSMDKSLPNGLTFDAATGVISGTPAIPSPPETYTVTAYNAGGSSTTTITIEIDEETIAFGPLPSKTVCDADFSPGATSPATITYTSDNPSVATIVSGKIHITGAGTALISASDGISSQGQRLTVDAAATPTITIAPDSPDNCQRVAVTYTATIANGGNSPSYQWQVNGQIAGGNSAQFTSNTLNDGDQVTCTLTSDAACVTSTMVVSNSSTYIVDPPVTTSITITSTAQSPVCPGTPITFIAQTVTPDQHPAFQWLINGKPAGTNTAVFTSSSLAEGDVITCSLTSTGKCLVNAIVLSNALTISLRPVNTCVIIIPNTFTPNGDGINDLWNITALVGYPNCTVEIFSRYGALVYSSTGYSKAWDGSYNGRPLPAGTYYYVVDPKNGMKKFAGAVTIVK